MVQLGVHVIMLYWVRSTPQRLVRPTQCSPHANVALWLVVASLLLNRGVHSLDNGHNPFLMNHLVPRMLHSVLVYHHVTRYVATRFRL